MSDEPTIKAIETVYKGYRFRSRLEARWAVFFDALNWKYEYEPEGFDLGNVGGLYLPDFKLVDANGWVEVKPDTQIPDGEWLKVTSLVHTLNGTAYLVFGPPWMDKPVLEIQHDSAKGWCGLSIKEVLLMPCPYCGGFGWISSKCPDDFDGAEYQQLRNTVIKMPRLVEACTAARQARFEYGEHGC